MRKLPLVPCFARICVLLWRNREQVAMQMLLLLAVRILDDQYRPYPMHSARQYTHSSCNAFKHGSRVTPFIIVKSSLCYSNWVPRWLYWIKKACTVDSYLMRNLSLRLVPFHQSRSHIEDNVVKERKFWCLCYAHLHLVVTWVHNTMPAAVFNIGLSFLSLSTRMKLHALKYHKNTSKLLGLNSICNSDLAANSLLYA